MPTFVEVVPDAFAVQFDKNGDSRKSSFSKNPGLTASGDRARFEHVRRPVRGIEIKDDTYATIQVVSSDGRNMPLIDAAGIMKGKDGPVNGFTTHYSNFLIQGVTETRAEKQQIVLTFGEPFVFFYGEQPRIIQVQGVLLNTADFNWRAEFWENYDKYLRGTQCVRNKTRVYLSWDDIVVEGYIMTANAQEQAEQRNLVSFDFQMFLTNYQNISGIGDADGGRSKLKPLIPNQIDTLTSGTSDFKTNSIGIQISNIQKNPTNKSLLEALRDRQVLTALEIGTSRIVEFQDSVQNLLDRASDLVSGRNIRFPDGFIGGSAAFDGVAGQPIDTQAISSVYGPLSLNEDEFIGRGMPRQEPVDLFSSQKGDDDKAMKRVKDTFKAFGIDTEPPSEVQRLVAKVGFGVVSFVAGKALASTESQAARQAINVIPQIVT